jgi:hypothetical protein
MRAQGALEARGYRPTRSVPERGARGEVNVATLFDALVEEATRSESKLVVGITAIFGGVAVVLERLQQMLEPVLQNVAESPASPGYEPMLVQRGMHPISARAIARLTVSRGVRIADETIWYPQIRSALHVLWTWRRKRASGVKSARLLLRAWHQTSIIDTAFRNGKLDENELIRDLEAFASGDRTADERLRSSSAALLAFLPARPGRRVSAASAAHECLLRVFGGAYTWGVDAEDFTDELTLATRREFNNNDFIPQAARRRVRRG